MSGFEDVKIGDKLFYVQSVGVGGRGVYWSKTSFERDFVIECEVIRVTKTQFTTDVGRYRKSDGCGIGDSPRIYRIGDKLGGLHSSKYRFVEVCEKNEMKAWESRLDPIREVCHVGLARVNILNIAYLEDALRAAELIKELVEITKKCNA